MINPFMATAIRLAVENARSGHGGPFGAVVVRDDRIVAEGVNEVTALNDPSAHAEVMAIRAACQKLARFELSGCDLYSSCEPCPMCLGAIHWARLRRVYFGGVAADASQFGFDDSAIYIEFSRPLVERAIPMIQMMREESLEAFRVWKAVPDKKHY
jgi:tRNA(Arg) A34 adenosine deaminase TadA